MGVIIIIIVLIIIIIRIIIIIITTTITTIVIICFPAHDEPGTYRTSLACLQSSLSCASR